VTDLGVIVDADERIVRVAADHQPALSFYRGHTIWTALPQAEPLLRPLLEQASTTGDAVETTVFYAGGTVDVRVSPRGQFLAVRLRRRTELDIRTLATLARSLHAIEAELAALGPAQLDRPALASPPALP
jgi:hypothetical protein